MPSTEMGTYRAMAWPTLGKLCATPGPIPPPYPAPQAQAGDHAVPPLLWEKNIEAKVEGSDPVAVEVLISAVDVALAPANPVAEMTTIALCARHSPFDDTGVL